MRNLLEYKDLIEIETVSKNTSVRKLAPLIGVSYGVLYDIVNGKAQSLQVRTRRKLDDYFGPEEITDPLAELRAKVEALEKHAKNAGPALHKISLNDGQRQYLHDKYIVKDVVSVAGRVDDLKPNALETLYRLLFLWDEIIRKGKVNDGRPES